jgi:hypothetical protein
VRVRRLLVLCATTALCAIHLSTPRSLGAQDADVIRGRVTGVDGLPIEGARVTATSVSTAIVRPTRTDKNGRYTIVFPGDEGHYLITVSQIGYVLKTFELKRAADEDILVADAALQPIALDPVVTTATVRGTISRGSTTTDVSGTDLGIPGNSLTTAQTGDLAAMAASLPGVLLASGGSGFSILGLDPSDNTVTVNGITFDAGALPRESGVTSSLVTNPYDVSRGGFSGAQLNVRTATGSNVVTRGMSLNVVAPQLSLIDQASRAQGNNPTNLSLAGVAAGPITYNSAYYRVSYQYDRNSNPLQTLVNTSPIGLRSAGVASDSAARLLGVMDRLGIPAIVGVSPRHTVRDAASFAASVNVTPSASPTVATYALNVNASWNRNSPQNATTKSVPGFATTSDSKQGSLQARHTMYYKILLSETTVGVNGSSDASEPFLAIPSGRVRVNSTFDDGTSGVTDLSFGGNSNPGTSSSKFGANIINSLSWFSTNNKHRLKLATELNYNTSSSEQSSNYLGTFQFNSLADLEAGIPASYSRQLDRQPTRTGQVTNAISLGDTYRRSSDFQLQYGVRLDGGHYFEKPEYNPAVEATFGVRNDVVPARIYVSPRIGFTWTLGKAPEITAFEGAASAPRAIMRGGVALQQSALGSVSSVINNTGLPSAIQSLSCVGAASPIPDWQLYLADPDLVPEECADGSGGTVFSNSSPSVTLYARDFTTPRSIRSNLSWSRAIMDSRFGLTVTATHSLNLGRASQVDLNFNPTVRFTMDNEAGRPVFVEPSSIVSRTGAIASRDARISPAFSRVNEMRSDLRSQSEQVQFSLSPRRWVPIKGFSWRLAYTLQDVREQQRGFSSTVGNPLDVYWSRGTSTARHQVTYNVGYTFFRIVGVGWNGSVTSGRPYTPGIAGDINGDGSANDRPFIFDPAHTADPELAAAMQQLLGTTSRDARDCLLRQLGQLARRNSCQGRVAVTGDFMLRIDAVRFGLPHKTSIEFTFQNPLGGVDLLLHGSGRLRGWGQGQQNLDPTLLYVRGFDPATKRFKYEVNERFGTPRQTLVTLRDPMRITVLFKMDLGPAREMQNLKRSLSLGRTATGEKATALSLKQSGVNSIVNPIVSLLSQADSLHLSRAQEDSIARLNRRYTIRLDSIWDVAAKYLAELPDDFSNSEAWDRYLSARRAALDMMLIIAPAIHGLLTSSQLRKLPISTANALDTRYLRAVRDGTGAYAGVSLGGGGG